MFCFFLIFGGTKNMLYVIEVMTVERLIMIVEQLMT